MSLNEGQIYIQSNAQSLRLWVGWVVGTSLAGGLSYYVAGAIVTLAAQSDKVGQIYGGPNFMTGDNAIGSAVLWGFLILALVCPFIGLTQGLLLRTVLGYKQWKQWSLLTSLGVAIAILVAAVPCVGIMLGGIVVGSLEWIILGRTVDRAFRWIIAVSVAWIIGLLAGFLTATYILPQSWIAVFPSWPFYPMISVIYWTISLTIGLVVFSSISGFTLIWLLRDHNR